jgi:hypothetical protein
VRQASIYFVHVSALFDDFQENFAGVCVRGNLNIIGIHAHYYIL